MIRSVVGPAGVPFAGSPEANRVELVSPAGASALWAIQRGFPVLPVFRIIGDRCACRRGGGCSHPGKHPHGMASRGVNSATLDESKAALWFLACPDTNVAIATGHPLPEGGFLSVLDVDPRHDGDASLAELEERMGGLPVTLTVRTPSGGWHFYFSAPAPLRSRRGFLPGLELIGLGGYVLAPPSNHLRGTYQVETEAGLAAIPEWLLEISAPAERESSTGSAIAYDQEDVRDALLAIPRRPDYPEWIRIIAAVLDAVERDTSRAEELLEEWSPAERRGEYRRKLMEPLGDVTAATLFFLARENGWVSPHEQHGATIAARLMGKGTER